MSAIALALLVAAVQQFELAPPEASSRVSAAWSAVLGTCSLAALPSLAARTLLGVDSWVPSIVAAGLGVAWQIAVRKPARVLSAPQPWNPKFWNPGVLEP